MATLNLGRIKPVFRGAYSGGTAYVVDDIVTHGNESFICIQAHGAGTQATSVTAYWTKLAAKGTDGTDVGTTITTQGDVLYRDGSGLQRLAKPASNKMLQNTSGGVLSWETPSGGKILQAITVVQPAVVSVAGNSTFNSFTGLTCTITPTAASSKIFITGQLCLAANDDCAIRIGETIDGGSVTGVLIGNQIGSNRARASSAGQHRNLHEMVYQGITGLVSPSYTLTDVLTYSWQGYDTGAAIYTNREATDSDGTDDSTGCCTLTVMELGA